VTGIVSIPLVITILGSGLAGLAGVVLGIAALDRIRGHPERTGRGMAISGIATGAVGIALTVLVIALPGDEEDYNELDTVSYQNLRTGDCYERDVSGFGVTLEDCTAGHDREVVGIVDHSAPPRAPFPGREELEAQAADLCRPIYDRYLGPGDRSMLVPRNLQPSRRAWRDGERRIVCSVERVDGEPLIGSVKDGGGRF
jgi:hypothetical protein